MSSQIIDLEPVTRGLCHALLASWEESMRHPIRVTHTLRTFDEQLHLWQQGRALQNGVWKVADRKLVVTNAEPGESPHNYGAAFDICFLGDDPYLHAYEIDHRASDPLWGLFGEAGKKLGLVWGGDFSSLKDRPHMERPAWRALRPAA